MKNAPTRMYRSGQSGAPFADGHSAVIGGGMVGRSVGGWRVGGVSVGSPSVGSGLTSVWLERVVGLADEPGGTGVLLLNRMGMRTASIATKATPRPTLSAAG